MPDLKEYFPEIFEMEAHELFALRDEILSECRETGEYKDLSDESLAKLGAVQRALRNKAAPAARPSRRAPKKKQPATLEDLA